MDLREVVVKVRAGTELVVVAGKEPGWGLAWAMACLEMEREKGS